MQASWAIRSDAGETTALYEPATSDRLDVLLVCAHGAGGNMLDRGMLTLRRALTAHGIDVLSFNFFYSEKKQGRPDPMPRLIQCYTAVVERARQELEPRRLLMGGRSMGGRAASMMAADGYACDGLMLFAYPLHPAGQPHKLRDAHLPGIQVPVLCINGTRDPLCSPELMQKTISGLGSGWTMHWIDGADHSFHVLKSSGRTDQEVMQEIGSTAQAWASASVS